MNAVTARSFRTVSESLPAVASHLIHWRPISRAGSNLESHTVHGDHLPRVVVVVAVVADVVAAVADAAASAAATKPPARRPALAIKRVPAPAPSERACPSNPAGPPAEAAVAAANSNVRRGHRRRGGGDGALRPPPTAPEERCARRAAAGVAVRVRDDRAEHLRRASPTKATEKNDVRFRTATRLTALSNAQTRAQRARASGDAACSIAPLLFITNRSPHSHSFTLSSRCAARLTHHRRRRAVCLNGRRMQQPPGHCSDIR